MPGLIAMLQCPTCGRRYAEDLQMCPEDGALLQADSTVATAVEADPLIGRTFDDKYRLDERLGEGGMGTVYRATHLLIDRPVAVKVLNPRFVTDEAAKERFRREARAAGRLRHTNAVAVTDFGQTSDGFVYIVMELLEGRSLRDMLAREAPLDTARSVSLMLQISAAVAAAHEAGIIHRDLKPGNIYLMRRTHAPTIVKVLDFGIAKLASDASVDGDDPQTLTKTGVMIGTPRYMSPEQCDGAELTAASDVYSLGIILYEMLAGATPFSGATPLAVALKHSAELPRPPREFVSSIPQPLEDFVLRVLEKNPELRPQDAGAFRRELYAIGQQLGLEHADGFSAPTLDSLREAGKETPSGRLVIDIERLRESQAARARTSEAHASETEREIIIQTGGEKASESEVPAHNSSAASSEPDVPSAVPAAPKAEITPVDEVAAVENSTAAAPPSAVEARPVARVKIPLDRKKALREWVRQPMVLVMLGLAALSLVVILFSFIGSRWSKSAGAADDAEATGRFVTPVENGQKPVAPARAPTTAAEFNERGAYYFSTREYDAAIKDFKRAIELQKEFPTAHNRLGRALMAKGQLGAAVEEFRLAISQSGGAFAAAQYNLGFALQQQGDAENAIKAYDAAIEQHGGTYPDAFYQKGTVLLGLRRDAEAATSLRKAIEQNNGRDPDAQFALGTALARQQDYPNAEQSFRAAIEQRDGNFAAAHFNLGYLYEQTERLNEAITEYETYLRQNPTAANKQIVENTLRDLRRRVAGESGK